jgi:aminodeoxyfutalosine deaminase
MKFSADLILSEDGSFLTQSYIETDETGSIIAVESIDGVDNVLFSPGIIVPGFFNCHVHLEPAGADFGVSDGLPDFLSKMKDYLNQNAGKDNSENMKTLDNFFYYQGIEFCADISNTNQTIELKKNSKISYFTFIEIFESLNDDPEKKFQSALKFKSEFDKQQLKNSLVPHSLYSISPKLIYLLGSYNKENKEISSIHFKESSKENNLFNFQHDIYKSLNNSYIEHFKKKFIRKDILPALDELFDQKQKQLYVHAIYMNEKERDWICKKQINSALCICPTSNLLIEKNMINVEHLKFFENRVFLGTDSQASNPEMNFMKEMFLFQEHFKFSLKEILLMSSTHPAVFFNEEKKGKIKPGNTPGLVLINQCDLENRKLTRESRSMRLI